MRPKGEAVIELDISAVNDQAVAQVHDLKITSTNSIFDLAGQALAKPLGIWLAGQLDQAINEATDFVLASPTYPTRMNVSKSRNNRHPAITAPIAPVP